MSEGNEYPYQWKRFEFFRRKTKDLYEYYKKQYPNPYVPYNRVLSLKERIKFLDRIMVLSDDAAIEAIDAAIQKMQIHYDFWDTELQGWINNPHEVTRAKANRHACYEKLTYLRALRNNQRYDWRKHWPRGKLFPYIEEQP